MRVEKRHRFLKDHSVLIEGLTPRQAKEHMLDVAREHMKAEGLDPVGLVRWTKPRSWGNPTRCWWCRVGDWIYYTS